MSDINELLDIADEVETRFTEINSRIRDIMGLLLEITETFGLVTGELYQLKDELEEMEANDGH